jgi:hypothetical protein
MTQRVVPDFHLFLPSVPWRKESYERLLSRLSRQTALPSDVHVILDGYGHGSTPDLSPLAWDGSRIHVHRNVEKKGAQHRWFLIESLGGGKLAATLDDDLIVGADLLKRHIAALESGADAVSSGGVDEDGAFHPCHARDFQYEGDVVLLQVGVFTLRSEAFTGLSSHPLGQWMKSGRDDESAISAYLWQQGKKMRRVYAPVGFDASAYDGKSLSIAGLEKRKADRAELRQTMGWPYKYEHG